jgi:hypothetical protein
MLTHDFLRGLHERLRPRTYFEIGVGCGHSLALSRCRSIGVDPAFAVDQELNAPVSLVRSTSDAYFARLEEEGSAPFGELPIDLGFVDGMHHFEYALRDFIGIERHAAPTSVVAFDDVLPQSAEEAARDRVTIAWTGDVFRIAEALATHRPDLATLVVATEPAGTLLVTRLDPGSRVLAERMDEIVGEQVRPDPQPVPPDVLERANAVPPEEALALGIWDELRAGRDGSRLSLELH